MNDKLPLFVRFEPSRIAVRCSVHYGIGILFQIARVETQLPQHRSQQTGADLLAAIFQGGAAPAIAKGSMAALALQFIEPDFDPALSTRAA
jgi:hypothetical protein